MDSKNKILEQKSRIVRTSNCNSIQIDIDRVDNFEIQTIKRRYNTFFIKSDFISICQRRFKGIKSQ